MNYHFRLSFSLLLALLAQSPAAAQCIQQPDGTYACQPDRQQQPAAKPTAMDVRIHCPAARGSGTCVARAKDGGTLVLTNYHVIEGQSRIIVHSKCGTATATLVAADQLHDLAVLAIRPRWQFVKLGGAVTVGTPVQFRAFDRGVEFRKYFGTVTVEYFGSDGTRGWFATGDSTAGNSGGGVYSRGRLVGVLWGNPQGGTAFVPIGPVRALLERALGGGSRQSSEIAPIAPPKSGDNGYERGKSNSPTQDSPGSGTRQSSDSAPAIRPKPGDSRDVLPSVRYSLDWRTVAAAAFGVSTPLGVAIIAAGLLFRTQRHLATRGQGGPRDEPFPAAHDRPSHQ